MQHKQALVTGASRGIGTAVAKVLQNDGYFVVGTATTEEGAACISDVLGKGGQGVVLNVNDLQSIEQVFSSLDHLHVLVNNAGVVRDNLLLRMKEEEWEEVIDTNLRGVFRLSKAACKKMLRTQNGRIINIASVAGAMGNPGQCNYAAAKAGLFGFSKSLAKEMGMRGITVNVVAPGFVETDMIKNLEVSEQTLSNIPMGRLGHVNDIAHAVSFLAGPHASYVTGHILHVNGGLYMA